MRVDAMAKENYRNGHGEKCWFASTLGLKAVFSNACNSVAILGIKLLVK